MMVTVVQPQFTGAGAAPLSVEGQTGLQGLLVNVVPQLLAAHFTDIVESATGDYTDLELQVNTAHRNGTFTPQVDPKAIILHGTHERI